MIRHPSRPLTPPSSIQISTAPLFAPCSLHEPRSIEDVNDTEAKLVTLVSNTHDHDPLTRDKIIHGIIALSNPLKTSLAAPRHGNTLGLAILISSASAPETEQEIWEMKEEVLKKYGSTADNEPVGEGEKIIGVAFEEEIRSSYLEKRMMKIFPFKRIRSWEWDFPKVRHEKLVEMIMECGNEGVRDMTVGKKVLDEDEDEVRRGVMQGMIKTADGSQQGDPSRFLEVPRVTASASAWFRPIASSLKKRKSEDPALMEAVQRFDEESTQSAPRVKRQSRHRKVR